MKTLPSVPKNKVILIADDDFDDRMLIKRALRKSYPDIAIKEVEDGEELMEYLSHRGQFADKTTAPRPTLILLDLNMPRKSGQDALQEIKSDATLRQIPVIVLTTSKEHQDVLSTYDLGVNAFVTKPISIEGLNQAMQSVGAFWFGTAQTPNDE